MQEDKKQLMRQQPTRLVPLAEFVRDGVVSGIILSQNDTKIFLMEMNGVSGKTLALYADELNARYFTVHGTWTFVPDLESVKEYDRPAG